MIGATIIVGHGPSLRGAGRGPEIDDHETVVRLSQGRGLYWQDEVDYGCKTDHVVVTQQNIGDLINWPVEAEAWIWTRPGWRDDGEVFQRLASSKHPFLFCNETDDWAANFASIEPRGHCSERDPRPIFSTGLAAIIIAASRLRQDIITAGFDEWWDGDMGKFHDWKAERELLPEISEHYGVSVSRWN